MNKIVLKDHCTFFLSLFYNGVLHCLNNEHIELHSHSFPINFLSVTKKGLQYYVYYRPPQKQGKINNRGEPTCTKSIFYAFFLFHLRRICKDKPEKTIITLPHCFADNGFPLTTEETTMLMNLRVVVMVVFVRDPNRLIVKKIKFWPIAPHKQYTRISHAASGWVPQKFNASKPLA